MQRQRFTVRACGTVANAEEYEMELVIDDRGITLDGMRMTWNEARAAIDCSREIHRSRRALFGAER
jgi:hypothetical protein